jgi:hypothetical protein
MTVRTRSIATCFALAFLLLAGCQETARPSIPIGLLDGLPLLTNDQAQRARNVVDIPPGTVVELADLKGPGVIRHIWITAREGGDRLYKDLVLRMYWDGEPHPSVEVPLGDFFTVGWGEERDVASLVVEMIPAILPNHAALNCWWPMPFETARIEIEHQGSEPVQLFFWIINWERVAALPADCGRFHAQWNRQNPVPRGGPYVILEAEGRGRYAGTIMNYHLLEPGSWVEGGELIYIDGDDRPTLEGTGAEDYMGLAWGFRPDHKLLFHGTSFGPVIDRMSAYRFHILDPIRFQKSIRVTMRCHGWDVQARSDDYSSVALWYQTEPHRPFPTLPAPEDRVPPDLGPPIRTQ